MHFRSLRDPIDTSTPQGMFSLQVLGAVAQLERALIVERTKSGMKAAKARGRLAGNPGLRERQPESTCGLGRSSPRLFGRTDLVGADMAANRAAATPAA